MSTLRKEVFVAIDFERAYQDRRWNAQTTTSGGKHSPQEWLTYIHHYVEEALKIGCTQPDQHAAPQQMHAMRKIAALAVAAMEEHGAPLR